MAGRHIGYYRMFLSGDKYKAGQLATRVRQQMGIMLDLMEKQGIERWQMTHAYPDGSIIQTTANPPYFYNAKVYYPQLVDDRPIKSIFDFLLVFQPTTALSDNPYDTYTSNGSYYWDENSDVYFTSSTNSTDYNNNVLNGPYNIDTIRLTPNGKVVTGSNGLMPYARETYSPTGHYAYWESPITSYYWGDFTTKNHAIMFNPLENYYSNWPGRMFYIYSPLFTAQASTGYTYRTGLDIYGATAGFTVTVRDGVPYIYLFLNYYNNERMVVINTITDVSTTYDGDLVCIPYAWGNHQSVVFDHTGLVGKGVGLVSQGGDPEAWCVVDYTIDPDTGELSFVKTFYSDWDLLDSTSGTTGTNHLLLQSCPNPSITKDPSSIAPIDYGAADIQYYFSNTPNTIPIAPMLLDDGVTFFISTAVVTISTTSGSITGSLEAVPTVTFIETCSNNVSYHKVEWELKGSRTVNFVTTATMEVTYLPGLTTTTTAIKTHKHSATLVNYKKPMIDFTSSDCGVYSYGFEYSGSMNCSTEAESTGSTQIIHFAVPNHTAYDPSYAVYTYNAGTKMPLKVRSIPHADIAAGSYDKAMNSYFISAEMSVEYFLHGKSVHKIEVRDTPTHSAGAVEENSQYAHAWVGVTSGTYSSTTPLKGNIDWLSLVSYFVYEVTGGSRVGDSFSLDTFFVAPDGSAVITTGEFHPNTDTAHWTSQYTVTRQAVDDVKSYIFTNLQPDRVLTLYVSPDGKVTDITELLATSVGASLRADFKKQFQCVAIVPTGAV